GRSPDLPALPDALRGPFLWTPTPSPVPGVTGAIELSCGDDVDCVRDSEGAACWTAGLHGPGADAMPPTRLPVAGGAGRGGGPPSPEPADQKPLFLNAWVSSIPGRSWCGVCHSSFLTTVAPM